MRNLKNRIEAKVSDNYSLLIEVYEEESNGGFYVSTDAHFRKSARLYKECDFPMELALAGEEGENFVFFDHALNMKWGKTRNKTFFDTSLDNARAKQLRYLRSQLEALTEYLSGTKKGKRRK